MNCIGLTSVTIPNSVTSIGDRAFSDCSGLTSVTIPNSVTSIGYEAFRDCTSLTSITIPNSVTSIGWSAFFGCSGLTSVTIPNSVTSIASHAFQRCSGLTSVTIPNSVTSIGYYAFDGCSGLTSVTIPNSVTSIDEGAFSGCSGLTSIKVENGNEKYDSRNNCNAIIETSSNTLIAGCKNTIIPNSVTSIGSGAFYNCSGLTSVTIPSSVTSIGNDAFSGCSGLTSVAIPNSVTSISNSAFSGCSGLTSITIPNSVTSIGWYAFYGCSGLTSVTIPNSVTSIGDDAFDGCSGLTSVTIPNIVTSIGSSAFSGCSGLTSIVSLNSNPPSLQYSSVFYNVDKNICVVWVPKGSLSAYKGAAEWKDFANIFELVGGDLNLDELVDQDDMDALVGFVMGEKPDGFYEGLADLNGDDKVNAADVVMMVDLVRASSGISVDCQLDFENVNGNLVVSSLSCTLNNERSEAIQLTKCELYCNHNLVSSKNFSGASASVQAGGSKECTFNNLAKLNSSTGFTVCWYYTASGKNYVYRCPLKD